MDIISYHQGPYSQKVELQFPGIEAPNSKDFLNFGIHKETHGIQFIGIQFSGIKISK